MNKCVITKHNNYCLIAGNYPIKDILDITSTNNRQLADYQKKQRGWLESKDELELIRLIWEKAHNKISTITFQGKELTIDQAKAKISTKAQKEIVGILMASASEFNRKAANCIDDRFTMFDHLEGTFPIGILPEVEDTLTRSLTSYKIIDKRTVPNKVHTHWKLNEDIVLRKPQEKIRTLFEEDEHFGFEWSVGSGKTMALTITIVDKQVNSLVIVPSLSLVDQTIEKILNCTNITKDEIGKVCTGFNQLRPITVTTINSLESKLEDFIKFGYDQLLVDEAHYAGARGLFEAISEIPSYYRYFASGTMYRLDHEKRVPGQLDMVGENMLLKGLIGKIKDYRSYEDGVDDGYLCKVTVECVDPGPALPGCGYREARTKGIINNAYRNSNFGKRIKELTDDNKIVLCLVVEQKHAEILQECFIDTEVYAPIICKDTSASLRKTIIDDLRNRDINCVIGTPCIRTGLDISTLDVVANIGGMKSYRTTIQGSGRGTRAGSLVDEDNLISYIKEGAIVLDCMDTHHNILEQHALQRMQAYHKEGFDVPHLKEYLEDQQMVVERQKKKARRMVEENKNKNIMRLPKLKKQLIEMQILRDDPDAKSDMSLLEIKKHIDRLQNEINLIEFQFKRSKTELGSVSEEDSD